MNSKIKGIENKMSGGIASAMAMAGLPQAYAPGANMTSIAGGTFNGESAVAIGVSMVSESGGWVYKLQGTSNSRAITLQPLARASSGNEVTTLPTSKAMA
ncbi:YadA-like family protein [Salmonella sp. WGH-01]|nr:YadA-like family protein [Salmonella sp. WGH-01]